MTNTEPSIAPLTVGDAMRLIGRFTESEGGNSPETLEARRRLYDAYLAWCDAGRPEYGGTPSTPTDAARLGVATNAAGWALFAEGATEDQVHITDEQRAQARTVAELVVAHLDEYDKRSPK